MRDYLLDFGKAKTVATATAVTAEYVLEFLGSKQTVGLEAGVNLVVLPSRKILEDETVTISIQESDASDGTFKTIATYVHTGEEVEAGFPIKFRFPRITKQYVKATGMVTKGASAFAACDLDISIQQG